MMNGAAKYPDMRNFGLNNCLKVLPDFLKDFLNPKYLRKTLN